jgi:cell wall assembly regulator SMI1
MQDALSRLFQAIETQTGMAELPFAGGADSAEIEKATDETGLQLPKDYKEFLRRHDGQLEDAELYFPPGQLKFLSIVGAMGLWRELKEYEDDEFFDEMEDEGRVRAVTHHSKRFPIAYYESGTQYLFLDYIPGDRGHKGQLIFNPAEASFYVLADSFSVLISDYLKLLEAGTARVVKQPPEYGEGYWFATADGEPLTFERYSELLRG